jgi:hypothetical protein
MSITAEQRPSGVFAVFAATGSILVVLIAAQAAGASTIHACVKPKSGATRIVGAKAKCRRGEQKLSWGTTGPQGPAGASGAPGARGPEGLPGANGSGPDYVAFEAEGVTLSENAPTTVVKKVLPPGSYALGARTTLVASAKAASFAAVICSLSDAVGTTGSGLSKVEDEAAWASPLGKESGGEFLADGPLMLEGSLTSADTTTLTVACTEFQPQSVSAEFTELHALNVTAIK